MIRRVCFVTGTRAEFGLMRRTLEAIRDHPQLKLQLVVTGMHLHARHGRSIDAIRREGWTIDAVVPWKHTADDAAALAAVMGGAIGRMARVFQELSSDIVLVTGDRVEAFAAAAAAHVSHRALAHVHGGDRAPGQIDDSLRHAISKLAHLHFPATRSSAQRLIRLGEDKWRIHQVGSPGIDGIVDDAAPFESLHQRFPNLARRRFALLVLHPVESADVEYRRAHAVLRALRRCHVDQLVAIYPNNDPGSGGIIRCLELHRDRFAHLLHDTPRPTYLGLLREAAFLIGNSSSGIIEAASFGTPVVDIGPRQLGRDRSENVTAVPYGEASVRAAVKKIWHAGRPQRCRGRNLYGGKRTGARVAGVLASADLSASPMRRKLITY